MFIYNASVARGSWGWRRQSVQKEKTRTPDAWLVLRTFTRRKGCVDVGKVVILDVLLLVSAKINTARRKAKEAAANVKQNRTK